MVKRGDGKDTKFQVNANSLKREKAHKTQNEQSRKCPIAKADRFSGSGYFAPIYR